MADPMEDPGMAPTHAGDTAGALGEILRDTWGVDFTRREGPGGRKSEFMAGAARGISESGMSKTLAAKGGGLRKLFAGAASVE